MTGVVVVAAGCTAQPADSNPTTGDAVKAGEVKPLAGAAAASGASEKDSIVEAQLIANTTAVKPGESFKVAVHYKIQPEWHIYYKYPGESGFATTVNWSVPEKASISETEYPTPIAFEAPGPVTSFGYEGEAMLIADVTVPAAPPEGKVQITAKSRWLMCSDRCIPNSKELTLTLPIGDPAPANQAAFEKFGALLPQKAGNLPAEAKVEATPSGSSNTFKLTITPPEGKKIVADKGEKGAEAHSAFFYPAPEKGYVLDIPKAEGKTADAAGVKVYDGPVTITWKADPEVNAAEPLKRLDGTLVYQFVSDDKLEKPVALEINQAL